MTKKRETHPAYSAVMKAIEPMTAAQLARELGVTRALLHYYSKPGGSGFPDELLPRISKITGIPKEQISVTHAIVPTPIWDKMTSRLKPADMEQITVLPQRKPYGG